MTTRVRELLGLEGPIARALGAGYEPREEQTRMAEAVAAAMEGRAHLVAEAGTGVGKSYAYLLPAIERCVLHNEVVVVATHTIALQEQLLRKDVPLLCAALGVGGDEGEDEDDEDVGDDLDGSGESHGATEPRGRGGGSGTAAGGVFGPLASPLRPVLVKGRGNYLSIRRLKLASERSLRVLPDAAARRTLAAIEDWAYETEDGTAATLPPLERPGVWDRVQSDSGNCMGRKCPTYQTCFYQRSRRQMERGNLLICNHAVFFSDLALRARTGGEGGFLPRYHHVVLDEAHMVEDVASDHFGLRLGEGRVAHLLNTLWQRKTGKGYLAQLHFSGADLEAVERAIGLVHECERASREMFGELAELHAAGRLRNGRVPQANLVANPLTEAANRLAIQLRRLKEATPRDADKYELNAYAQRAAEIADHAEQLITQTAAGCCYWVETSGGADDDDEDDNPRRVQNRGRSALRRVTLACSPIEVGPVLKEHLFGQPFSVTMTSATLATRTVEPGETAERAETAFAYFLSRCGGEGARTLQVGSPFDYARQAVCIVDVTMPEPWGGGGGSGGGGRGGGGYIRALVERVLDHVSATEGGAFVLFTSFATLEAVALEVAEPLGALGMPLLVQGRGPGGGSRTELVERFREAGNAVLLGAASFWQGVDVRGAALRNVIITRLPFDPPDRPLVEARLERIRERGGDPFREESIPRAVIRFKQGFGRLVRSREDTGRVVVLDPRVVTKPYGRAFVRALPVGVRVEELREG